MDRSAHSLRVLVASADRHDLVEVWDALIGVVQEPAPPSTLMGVTVLGHPGQLVELEAVAAVAVEVTGQPPLA
ncbi:hypothetical protein [Arthrobacter sp. NPDC092385]|uniref:hypothetical protein n=1 Tax=Arthrobacter sp. NPDC092385 TaxID=3363943 RepID=UPI00382346D4